MYIHNPQDRPADGRGGAGVRRRAGARDQRRLPGRRCVISLFLHKCIYIHISVL